MHINNLYHQRDRMENVSVAKKENIAEKKVAEQAKAKNTGIKPLYLVGAAIIIILLVGIVYVLFNSTSATVAETGDNVSVYYTGKFTNGTVFNTNVGSAPFNFTIGKNEVITGFNNAVIGMKVGENKTVALPPSEAYGEVNQSLIITVPKSRFANSSSVKVGMIVTTGTGQQGEVIAVNATNATVDFNPPLAGKTLVFQIELVSVKK